MGEGGQNLNRKDPNRHMFRRFLLPFVVSFIALDLLGGLIGSLMSILVQLIVPITTINPLIPFVLGYVITYIIVVAFAFLRYRQDSWRLVAIILGPIILFPLQCAVLTLILIRILSLSGI